MQAMVLKKISPIENAPLNKEELPLPVAAAGEIIVRVSACGVCHTELDEIEGRLAAGLPVVPGHQVIGRVASIGAGARRFFLGQRVGIAWIHSACGSCAFCLNGKENLCPDFKGTGCHAPGGYAQYLQIHEDFAYLIPESFSDAQAAPLLCAGAIGCRDLRLAGVKKDQTLGLFGFGASAHIVIQLARYLGCEVFVFTRGKQHRDLAEKLGASWIGGPEERPPRKLHAAIDFTPVGETVPLALRSLEAGGRLVIAVIRKRNLVPPLDYSQHLWEEKEIKSVANITRSDVVDFLALAADIPIIPEIQEFHWEEANQALLLLKQGKIRGSAVLRVAD